LTLFVKYKRNCYHVYFTKFFTIKQGPNKDLGGSSKNGAGDDDLLLSNIITIPAPFGCCQNKKKGITFEALPWVADTNRKVPQ
jgi:hypothetical protein